jgi:integrase
MGSVFRKAGRGIWMIRYYRNGRPIEESSHTDNRKKAGKVLRSRETDLDRGLPLSPTVGRIPFGEAAADMVADYQTNQKRSLGDLKGRITNHLQPFFGEHRLLVTITTPDIRRYIAHRQAETVIVRQAYWITDADGTAREIPAECRPVQNSTINRELTILKRIFTLAMQAGKILHRPHVPLLTERNIRTGFFEVEQFLAVRAHLPAELRPVVTFAYLTGWRIASEIQPLEWRHVDFNAGEVRLDAGTTKNDDGRVFVMTDDLRALLRERQQEAARLKRIVPWVFFRLVSQGRGGPKEPRPITTFTKAWKAACVAAGCPGRIPHDLRRTAVRNMVRAGVPERVAMKLTGHKTRSVFERYNIVSDSDLATAARRLSGQFVIADAAER